MRSTLVFRLSFVPNHLDCDSFQLPTLSSHESKQIESDVDVLLNYRDAPLTSNHLWHHPSGIYKVFYLLIDGMATALLQCQDAVQKSTCKVFMTILTCILEAKGNAGRII